MGDHHRYTPASSLKVVLPCHTLPRPVVPSAPPVFNQDDHWFNDTANGHPQNIMLNELPEGNGSSSNNAQSHLLTPPPNVVDDEPEPTAPSIELLDKVTGYEDASFDDFFVPPPLVPSHPPEEEHPQRDPLPTGPTITEAEARKCLLKYVAQQCCYGKSAAKDMAVTTIDHSCAFHYTLETFTEKRSTAWAFEPYTGGVVDGPTEGTPPMPWEVVVLPPANFNNGSMETEVPHTAAVKMCHTCGGVGRKRCYFCSGNGWEYCNLCQGDGQKNTLHGQVDRCFQCHGTGRKKCWKCNGDGIAACRSCSGTGQIKCFIRLTATWTNHIDEHVVKSSALPDDKVKLSSGQVVFQEEQPFVYPINHFPDTTVNIASAQLVQQHACAYPMEKILKQRHYIRIVPVATIHFNWRGESNSFIVYGFERKIYAPDYPQKCCCCCVLL